MEEFKKWRHNPENISSLKDEDSEDNFDIFYQYYTLDKQLGSFQAVITDLAYQIYELQVCVEGLIQDQEQNY